MTVTTVPDRSTAQRMEALEKGNRIRVTRAEWKRSAKAGRGDLLKPLLTSGEEDSPFATMKVIDYLLAIPKVGRTKVGKLLSRAGVAPSKTLGGLSDRQRRDLVLLIAPWCGS